MKIALDFDGVLFNSAYEAFAVANKARDFLPKNFSSTKDMIFSEFLELLPSIGNSSDYCRYFVSSPKAKDYNDKQDPVVTQFVQSFYAARQELSSEPNYIERYFPAFEFFHLIKPLLLTQPKRFVILSTRDEQSILKALQCHGLQMEGRVYGQQHFKNHGESKRSVISAMLKNENLALFIDDNLFHVNELSDVADICLQADWGYSPPGIASVSCEVAHSIIKYLATKCM